MTGYDRIQDEYGDYMIRVYECENFRAIPQDIPIFIGESIHNMEKRENLRMYDIMAKVESYLYDNSGE